MNKKLNYNAEKNIYDHSIKEFEAEIGDEKQKDFMPQIKIKKWGNDANFSLRFDDPHYKNSVISLDGDVVKYTQPGFEARFYYADGGEIDEDGAFEFEMFFTQQLPNNRLRFTIRTKEIDCFIQPELTPEEIAEGHIREEKVIGSIAVYHRSKKHNEFKTGKLFHLYRPNITDASGKMVWCDWELHENSQDLYIVIPQEFLMEAQYPLLLDPTFGYTSVGASYYSLVGGRIATLETQTPSVDGVITSICFYASLNGNYSCAVYSAPYDKNPAFLKRDSGDTTMGAGFDGVHVWRTSNPINYTYKANTLITLGTNALNQRYFEYDSGAATGISTGTARYSAVNGKIEYPNVASVNYNLAYFFSMYANYTTEPPPNKVGKFARIKNLIKMKTSRR